MVFKLVYQYDKKSNYDENITSTLSKGEKAMDFRATAIILVFCFIFVFSKKDKESLVSFFYSIFLATAVTVFLYFLYWLLFS